MIPDLYQIPLKDSKAAERIREIRRKKTAAPGWYQEQDDAADGTNLELTL
jgi:hypothetical protein